MTSFKSFSSFEEAAEFMAKATDAANASLAPEQAAITYGSTWARFDHLASDQLLIVGKVDTLDEIKAAEWATVGDEDDAPEDLAEEIEYEINRLAENHERGYMFGRAYSVYEPRGEFGDTHRANMWPIPESTFTACVEAFSNGAAIAQVPGLADAYTAWRDHELAKGATPEGD